jgi:hypothetical protein
MDNNKPLNKASFVSRKACLSDFMDDTETTKQNGYHNKNDTIQKNQREYGQRKRIKP